MFQWRESIDGEQVKKRESEGDNSWSQVRG